MDQAPFELRILGPTELRGTRPDLDDANVRPPKRLALLAYLALETADGFKRRDQIVALFWPDLPQDAARTQLRKAIFALRESLGSDAVISRGESEVQLDPSFVWCDAVALAEHVKGERWTEALALYRGALLDGLHPEGVAQEFEEWLEGRRTRLRELAAAAAWECSREEEIRGDRKAAAVMARRALDLTPDDEAGVRHLMELLDRHGDRGGALRVYSEWQARLQAEYGVEPAPETRKVARRVQAARKGESHETPPTTQLPAYVPVSPADDRGSPPAAGAAGIRHGSRWRLVLAAIPLLLVVLWAATREEAPPPPNSIAVLPLRSLGDSALFASSAVVAEELTNALIRTGALSVRSTSHAHDAVDTGGDVDRIGDRLGVAFVIDGAAQRGSDRMRITLRVVRVRDAVAIWAGTFDATAQEWPATAPKVAAEIAAVLREKSIAP